MPGDPVERMSPIEVVLAQVRSVKARGALRRWLARESAKLMPSDWMGEGFTEAQILGVYVEPYREHPSGVIMKITEAGERDKEFRAHNRARKDSPQFAEKHLAELVGSAIPLDNGGSIMFQSVAGGGFHKMREIDQALSHYLDPVKACRRITKSLLEEWNTDPNSKLESVGAVLDELLGDRLTGNGTVAAWATEHPRLLVDPMPWLSHGGQPLINPFALVGGDSLGGRLPSMIVTRGKVHGDLHPGNLLVSKTEDEMSYCLVDLSRYTPSGLLSWDPAYLTLTTIAKFLPHVDFRDREVLMHWVLDPLTSLRREVPLPLRATVSGVYEAVDELARRHGSSAAWEPQRLLCLTAIALILTGRSRLLSAESRAWFFWLAAQAATRLVPSSTPEFTPANDRLELPEHLFPADVISLADHRHPVSDVVEPSYLGPVSEEAESWTELVAELRVVQLDASDPATLAVSTEALRALLARTRSISNEDETNDLLDDLAATLDEALRPGATSADVRAAGAHADLLRTWLLAQIS